MNEENKRVYPCDNEPQRQYPCDSAPVRRAYPCDVPGGIGEQRNTENGADRREARGAGTQDASARRTVGKGRRGGNSSMSIVIRSEKKKTGTEEGIGRSERSNSRGGAFPRRGQSEGRRDFRRDGQGGRQDGFHRGSQAERQDSFRRGGQFERRDGFKRSGYERRDRDTFRRQEADDIENFDSSKELQVLENTSIGCFLDLGNGERVLLPFAEQVGKPAEGETVRVYLYKDKGGRLTATMRTPILKTGEIGVLKVAEITRIGIFLDNGMPKQLLVPFKEQICTPKPGSRVLVYLYKDKSGRQAATMRVYKHLSNETPYHAEDRAEGFVYEINPDIGVFVAVDNRYFGLIPKVEVYEHYQYGQTVSCRVLRVREDGKLDLSVREKSYAAIEQDAEAVLEEIIRQGGKLPYADKADAGLIEEIYHMSKNQFKRALGSLYRERRIAIDRGEDTVTLLEKN